LIVPRQVLPVDHAVLLRTAQDNRVIFVVPWGSTSIIGTTDTDFSDRPDHVTPDRQDTTYLLEAVHELMPQTEVSEADVISAYAGVRPLVAARGKRPSAVSREHVIAESPSGLITIAGGKLTTHRAMAEQLIDHAQKKLMRDFGVASRSHSPTIDLPLVEAVELDLPDAPPDVAAHLVHTYGADTLEILRLCEADEALCMPVVQGLPYIRAEAVYATQHEMSVTLNDFLIRRTHVIYESKDGGLLQAGSLAAEMGARLGWSNIRMEHEVARYEQQVSQTRRFR
jgi:glycerol-3-phosphate dehydrogenase